FFYAFRLIVQTLGYAAGTLSTPRESEELSHVEGSADWKTSGNQEPGIKPSANLSRLGAAWQHGKDRGGGPRNAACGECASATTGEHCWPKAVRTQEKRRQAAPPWRISHPLCQWSRSSERGGSGTPAW